MIVQDDQSSKIVWHFTRVAEIMDVFASVWHYAESSGTYARIHSVVPLLR